MHWEAWRTFFPAPGTVGLTLWHAPVPPTQTQPSPSRPRARPPSRQTRPSSNSILVPSSNFILQRRLLEVERARQGLIKASRTHGRCPPTVAYSTDWRTRRSKWLISQEAAFGSFRCERKCFVKIPEHTGVWAYWLLASEGIRSGPAYHGLCPPTRGCLGRLKKKAATLCHAGQPVDRRIP